MDPLRFSCVVYEKDGTTILETVEEVDLSPWGISTTIPRGFQSDGMSVPRFFWRFIGPPVNGATMAPSVAHDWLYTCQCVPRKAADDWYRKMLLLSGYPSWKARLAWIGIRAFGGLHWGKDEPGVNYTEEE